jgi:hypothetical protein
MKISSPTPVTTSNMTADNWSIWNANGTWKLPTENQRHSSTTTGSSAPRIWMNVAMESPKEPAMAKMGIQWASSLIHHLPRSRVIRNAASGRTGISQT